MGPVSWPLSARTRDLAARQEQGQPGKDQAVQLPAIQTTQFRRPCEKQCKHISFGHIHTSSDTPFRIVI